MTVLAERCADGVWIWQESVCQSEPAGSLTGFSFFSLTAISYCMLLKLHGTILQ